MRQCVPPEFGFATRQDPGLVLPVGASAHSDPRPSQSSSEFGNISPQLILQPMLAKDLRTSKTNKARSAQCSRALFGLPKSIRKVAEPTSHHREILQVRVGFGEFVELRLVVQIRLGDDKTADLLAGVSFDVGDSVNFLQIASHGGGAAASRHVRHTQ